MAYFVFTSFDEPKHSFNTLNEARRKAYSILTHTNKAWVWIEEHSSRIDGFIGSVMKEKHRFGYIYTWTGPTPHYTNKRWIVHNDGTITPY